MRKKYVYGVLLICFFIIPCVASTAADYADKLEKLGSKLSSLRKESDDLVPIEEAVFAVNDFLRTIAADSITTASETLKIDHDPINCYDFNGNLFAYVFLINDGNNQVIGYVTAGADKNGFTIYESCFDKSEYAPFLEYRNSFADTNSGAIIYSPPMNYILVGEEIQKDGSISNSYSDLRTAKKLDDSIINNSVIQNKHAAMKSSRNRENWDFIHQEYTVSAPTADYSKVALSKKTDRSKADLPNIYLQNPTTIPVSCQLVNFANFVSVGGTSYGGNQSWYTSSYRVNRGCGPVAGANIVSYWADKHMLFNPLFDNPSWAWTQSDFLTLMNKMWDAISPALWGTRYNVFVNGVKKYTKDKKVPFMNAKSTANNKSGLAAYICDGLNQDSPVVIVLYNNTDPAIEAYDWHWMTITRYATNSSGDAFLDVSTWGLHKTLNFDAMYAGSTSIFGGIYACYFVPEPFDIVFVIDTTGSMWDDIARVKSSVSGIIGYVDAHFTDYRIAVVDFRDHPVSPYGGPSDYPYSVKCGFTNNKATAINAINSLSIGWGNDWEESVYSGLMGAMNANGIGYWRDESIKAIIMMGDAPPHDPEPITGYTQQSVIDAANTLEGVIHKPMRPAPPTTNLRPNLNGIDLEKLFNAEPEGGVFCGGEPDIKPIHIYSIAIGGWSQTEAAFSALSEGTGGKMFVAPTARNVVDAIMEILGGLSEPDETPENNAPVCDWAVPSQTELWTVNNKMQDIQILNVTDPDGDEVSIEITAITQDEPVNNGKSKNGESDGSGIGTSTASIRAERDGNGNGRVYRISFIASDPDGNECDGYVYVSVLHDQSENHPCTDDGQIYDSTIP